MPISFTCPHCGTQTNVDDRFAGTSGACAACGKGITIPAPYPTSEPGTDGAVAGAAVAGAAAGGLSMLAIIMIVGAVFLVGLCILAMLVALLFPAIGARQSARRLQCANNLQQIAMAMQMYEGTYGSLPPAYIADENGKPMHSWRVLLLPYLEEDALYRQYNFDEPWDSPSNLAVAKQMPPVYGCFSDPQAASQETSYMVIVGPKTLFPGATPISLDDCPDGVSTTLCVVEAANSSVGWTDPTDLKAEQMLFEIGAGGNNEMGSFHPGGANVAFGDTRTQFLPDSTPAEELDALSTRNGGEDVYRMY